MFRTLVKWLINDKLTYTWLDYLDCLGYDCLYKLKYRLYKWDGIRLETYTDILFYNCANIILGILFWYFKLKLKNRTLKLFRWEWHIFEFRSRRRPQKCHLFISEGLKLRYLTFSWQKCCQSKSYWITMALTTTTSIATAMIQERKHWCLLLGCHMEKQLTPSLTTSFFLSLFLFFSYIPLILSRYLFFPLCILFCCYFSALFTYSK